MVSTRCILLNIHTNCCQDVISYRVESTNPFQVKECVKGDGEIIATLMHLNSVEESTTNILKASCQEHFKLMRHSKHI
jgi:hypothetical protein